MPKPSWWTQEHADLLRYIIECTPPDLPVNLTELTGCVDMAESNNENPVIGAFTALSEQISDLKATMEAKFDAQQRQLTRLEDRDEKIVSELSDLKGKVYHAHDNAITELEEENKEFVTRREFNGGLRRVETVVQRGENLMRWVGGLVGASILGSVVAVVARYMGWL